MTCCYAIIWMKECCYKQTMSDTEEEVPSTRPYAIERAKTGRASCKKCKNSLPAKELRWAKINPHNPFGSGSLKLWYHIDCFFEMKKGKDTKEIESADDIDGWDQLSSADKKLITQKIGPKFNATPKSKSSPNTSSKSKDNKFSEFQRIISNIANEPSYNNKASILEKFLKQGNGKKFEGDLELWLSMLMPKTIKRIYNLQSKQIVKLFSRIFDLNHQDMLDDLSSGDVSETVAKYFGRSRGIKPAVESTLSISEVNEFLQQLSELTQEDPQEKHFREFCKKCTANDLKTVIRLIKHDLKMNCGARHVLDAVHPEAYEAFQKSRNLQTILKDYAGHIGDGAQVLKGTKRKSSGLQLMTPIAPMLAEPCKNFDRAISKCPMGVYSEIKYDGERVQIHKKGHEFKFFSRNLKPVVDHKISRLRSSLPKAFPNANDLILDSEILMVNTETGNLLPFGTLGKHKKEECKSAETCLFIFDCLYFNGDDLTKRPIKERRQFLESNMTVIKNHVQLSEYKLLKTKNELVDMTKEVLKKGLEGLVLKPLDSVYEPGKRRWLKVKKDYLMQGEMADSADLVILGSWYGTGKMGGIYSIFLMGCYDESKRIWKTVTKVHSGLDDRQMDLMHTRLEPLMEKCDSNSKIPDWIKMNRTMIPNALAKDPFKMPVLEVEGAEFTKSDVHTACSISIRFPRIVKIRDDKSPKEATNLEELLHLFEESKSGIHLDKLNQLKTKGSPNNQSGKELTTQSSIKSFLKKNDEKVKIVEKSQNNSNDDKSASVPRKKLRTDISNDKNADGIEENVTMEVDGIFEGIVLYYTPELDEVAAEIKEFEKQGGLCTKDSLCSNLVLHSNKIISRNLDELRKTFNPHCNHYQLAWLKDSIQAKSQKNPLFYGVKLRQI